jgi:hypothetical protein
MAPSQPIPGPGPVDASVLGAALGVTDGGVVPPPAPVTGATVVAVGGLVVAVVGGLVVAVGAAVVAGVGVEPANVRLTVALSPAASP